MGVGVEGVEFYLSAPIVGGSVRERAHQDWAHQVYHVRPNSCKIDTV